MLFGVENVSCLSRFLYLSTLRYYCLSYRLTDAFNNARDRVRYLESLSPHLEALEANPPLPSILSSLLTAISTSVKQMEGLSRAYARSGYLAILFTKVWIEAEVKFLAGDYISALVSTFYTDF